MKITFNQVKCTTVSASQQCLCVFGQPDKDVQTCIDHHKLPTHQSGPYTNISIQGVQDFSELFETSEPPVYVDGFSPNLNKHLHIGHLCNMVIAKTLQSMGIGNKWIAVLGDTLIGDVKTKDALYTYKELCQMFDYKVQDIFLASEQVLPDGCLFDGTHQFAGTKVFHVGDQEIVGIKSAQVGGTSYFYQDVAVALKLNAPTLYITGFEQQQHFKNLKILFPHIQHLSLGHVTFAGKKMSSSNGQVIMLEDALKIMLETFNNDPQLSWNVLAGYMLKAAPQTNKTINSDTLNSPKQSDGLYLSYTLAKCFSAGVQILPVKKFNDPILQFLFHKAKSEILPHILLEALYNKAKYISGLYEKHNIKGNPNAQNVFQKPVSDLVHGMKLLGMYPVTKV